MSPERRPRRRVRKRRRILPRLLIALVVVLALGTVAAMLVNGGTKKNHSADVKSIQTWLKGLGYLKSKPDGKFGKSTATAVKKFQKAKHQKQSGLVGGGAKGTTGTWKALQVAYRNR